MIEIKPEVDQDAGVLELFGDEIAIDYEGCGTHTVRLRVLVSGHTISKTFESIVGVFADNRMTRDGFLAFAAAVWDRKKP